MSKPTVLPEFNKNETSMVPPDTQRKDDGFVVAGLVPEKPSYKLFNYMLNLYYKWINYFDDREKIATHNITTDADYTLTAAQNNYGRVTITDTGVILTTGRNVIFDNVERVILFENLTAQTLTVKTAAGTGIPVMPNQVMWLLNDGTNIERLVTDKIPKTGVQDTDDWNGVAYTDPDAVGGSPTAKIYPDGTVVGSTDNGSYVKHPDGTLECHRFLNGTIAVTTASGSVFASSAISMGTYPVAFVGGAPSLVAFSAAGTNTWLRHSVTDSAAVAGSATLISAVSQASVGYKISYIAKGKWK